MIRVVAFLFTAVLSLPAAAQDVLILGEIHDNPVHHAFQAERVGELQPAAIVFEMLTPAQASAVIPENRASKEKLAAALNWGESGWPDFSMYYPIFSAAPDAKIYGAQVPRDVARGVRDAGLVDSFSGDAALYGLTEPLSEPQQIKREAMQMAAHCDALPEELLPAMVDIQRLRDAELARAVVSAMRTTGGPVAVITGNGHARRDWGVPSYLQRVAPELDLLVIGQAESGRTIHGTFDELVTADPVDRPDPCAAFQ
jgi:uncharacterized iron-regulated protein